MDRLTKQFTTATIILVAIIIGLIAYIVRNVHNPEVDGVNAPTTFTQRQLEPGRRDLVKLCVEGKELLLLAHRDSSYSDLALWNFDLNGRPYPCKEQ